MNSPEHKIRQCQASRRSLALSAALPAETFKANSIPGKREKNKIKITHAADKPEREKINNDRWLSCRRLLLLLKLAALWI